MAPPRAGTLMPRGDDVSGALTKLLRNLVAEHTAELARERATVPSVQHPPGATCGAKTRRGTRCKRKDLYASGRCPLHGGLSTGPRTAAGKARSAANGKRGGRPRKKQSPCEVQKS